MASYDKEHIKSVAKGRWAECLASVGGISIDLLDGRPHACPKCGTGDDRFRYIDAEAGAILCNKCFNRENGDGLASLQWLTGCDFPTALAKAADFFGIKPLTKSKEADPARDLEFYPWNEVIVSLWCATKPPIKPHAVKAVGGRIARYRKEYSVIAIPIFGQLMEKGGPVGWVLYRANGQKLPRFDKNGEIVEWVKVKITHGSKKGIITKVKAEP